MNNELIERYIYAVVRRMPKRKRKDISEELRGLIDDMLLERCGDVTPTDKDVRVVLTELGDPTDLFSKYSEDKKDCLIGAPHYSLYKFLLKIILPCVALGISMALFISAVMSGFSEPWYYVVSEWFASLTSTLFAAFSFLTIIFAVLYHKDVKIGGSNSLDNLPTVPKKDEKISRVGSIIEVCFLIIATVIFIAYPDILCIIMTSEKVMIPIFDSNVIRNCWYIIVMFTAVGVIRECIKLIEGRYNLRVLVTTIVADILSVVLAFWFLFRRDILNGEFVNNIQIIFNNENEMVINIFSNFQYFLLGVVLFAIVLEAVTTLVKYLKYR